MQTDKNKMLFLGYLESDNPDTKTAIVKLNSSSRLPAFRSRVFVKKNNQYIPVGLIKDLIGPVKEPWVVITKKHNTSLGKDVEIYYEKKRIRKRNPRSKSNKGN
ncbi:MAG: hypothetical protein ACXAEU_17610 [Candidatus Hodarchaeales archaeon]|jgi:rRNA processing protein Gar1